MAAVDLLPLRDPNSSVLSTYAACMGAVCIFGKSSLRRWTSTASCLLILVALGWLRAPREIVLAVFLAEIAWFDRLHSPRRAVRLAGVICLTALVMGSLNRSFDPLLLDGWLHRWTVGWISAPFYDAEVAPAIYGLLLFPVGLAAVMATGTRLRVRLGGITVLMGALGLSRHQESIWPMALAVILLPAVLHGATSLTTIVRKTPGSERRTASEALWCLLVSSALFLGWIGSESTSPAMDSSRDIHAGATPRIGFVGAMHGSFEPVALPEAGPRDPLAPPRFGQFRLLLERLGAHTAVVATPDEVAQGDWDTLVTINFSGPAAKQLVEPLRRAVAAGTDLLLLADHTNLFNQILHTNDLLRDTGIELAFDSAVPLGLGTGWVGSVQSGRHPIFGPHRDGRSFSWGVGCSLRVQDPARTIAAGSRAFLDEGDASKPGGLGNLGRDSSEMLGGFPLAATSSLGAGRILACGDTSAVQDTALLEGRGFGLRLAGWLMGGGGTASDLGGSAWLARGLLLLLLMATCFTDIRFMWISAAVLLLGTGEAWFEQRMRNAVAIAEPAGARLSLLSQFTTGVSQGGDRIDVLLEQCASRGWAMSVSELDADAARDGAVALVDPWTRLDEEDTAQLLEYVQGGGQLLLFLGQRGARSAGLILSAFGLSLGMPLGRGAESSWEGPLAGRGGTPFFYSSYQIDGHGLSGVDVLASCFGRPVAVMGRLGQGKWLLVADAGIVLDRHTDPRRGGSRPGALTLQYLLDPILDRFGQAR